MKSDLENQQASRPSDENSPSQSSKAAYSSPTLRVYGFVGELTQGNAGTATDFGPTMKASDPRAKENIVRVGTHPLGFGLYLFDYLPKHRGQWGHDRQFGVMADEVEAVMPEAVSIHADGYKRVDYAMLGVRHPVH